MPAAGAPPVPQVPSSPHAPRRSALVTERKRECDMGDHRVAKTVVLDLVAEQTLEPRRGPRSAEPELLAEDAELGLEGLAGEVGQLGIIGDELRRVVEIVIFVEVRVRLSVVAEPERGIGERPDLLENPDLRRV